MSDARVVLRRDDLVEFLRAEAGGRPDRPADPEGLVLVSGAIARTNLEERLAAEGIGTDLVAVTTIEDLARDLVARDRGRPAVVLNPPLRRSAVEVALDGAADRDTPLGEFARRVPWEGGDVLEGVVAELDEYYRCTDAGADHDALLAVVDEVAPERPFAAEATAEHLRAFAALDERLAEFVGDPFTSRSHLVREARDAFDAWTAVTGDPEWVALATVSAIDNPTLRFLASIAAEAPLHLFSGAGTVDTLETRFRSPDVPVSVDRGPDEPTGIDPAARRLLRAATDHRDVTVGDGDGVRAVEVPDRRREVEFALRSAARRRQEGETALVVARDAGEYATAVEDVSLTADRPAHVETRREFRSLSAFRVVAATVRLLGAAAGPPGGDRPDGGGPTGVPPTAILAPLRAGVCPPGGTPWARDGEEADDAVDGWPLPPSAVRAVGAELRGRSPRPIPDWRADLPDGEPFDRVRSFLAWVERTGERPPEDGVALDGLVASLVAGHVAATGERRSRPFAGPAVDPGRALAAEKRPAYAGTLVRGSRAAGDAYDWLRGALDRPADWSTAVAAVRTGLGTESYGLPDDDAGAVPVVDAGNAHFRSADRAYVLGLAAERFPRSPRRYPFVHRAVREAVHRRAAEFPYLYLDGEAVRYEADLDAYEAALRTAATGITLVWPYKDAEGRDRPRSPFLDAVTVADGARTSVELSDWVTLGGDPDLATGARDLAPKELLRALGLAADAPAGRGPSAEGLRTAAGTVDPDVADRLVDGIERFERFRGDDD